MDFARFCIINAEVKAPFSIVFVNTITENSWCYFLPTIRNTWTYPICTTSVYKSDSSEFHRQNFSHNLQNFWHFGRACCPELMKSCTSEYLIYLYPTIWTAQVLNFQNHISTHFESNNIKCILMYIADIITSWEKFVQNIMLY